MSQLSMPTAILIFFIGSTTSSPTNEKSFIVNLRNAPYEEIISTEETITTIDTEEQGKAYITQFYPQREIDHMEIIDSSEDMKFLIQKFNSYVTNGNPMMNFRDYIALTNYESYGFITLNNEELRMRFPHQTFEMANTFFKLADRLGRYNVILEQHLKTKIPNIPNQENREPAKLWRGEARLKHEIHQLLKSGILENNDRFMSFSSNKDTATKFMQVRKKQFRNRIRVLYEMKARNELFYLDMSDVNYHHSTQEEVILFPGTKFTIVDNKMRTLPYSGEKYLHVRLLYTQKLTKDEWRQNHFRILTEYWERSQDSSMFSSSAEKPQPPVPARRRSLEIAEVSECFSGTRSKRHVQTCPITWADLDKVSANKVRDLRAITFDSEKVLNYIKNTEDPVKKNIVLTIARQTRIKDSNRILGQRQEVFERVLDAESYENYTKDKRITMLKNSGVVESSRIAPKFKYGLITAAGKIQLVYGAYGILKQLREEDPNAVFSIAAFGYSLAYQKIEETVMKSYFQTVNALTIARQINPTPETGLVRELVASEAAKIGLRAGVGVAMSIFNVVDIAKSSYALVECSIVANSCTSKQVQDHVASITLSGVSLVSTVALSVAGMTGPIGVFIGLGIMVTGMIYQDISTEIEYSNLYELTFNEKFSTFWHSALFLDVPDDVHELAEASKKVNAIMKNSLIKLQNLPDNIVGYAMGFGKRVAKKKITSFVNPQSVIVPSHLLMMQPVHKLHVNTFVEQDDVKCEIDMSEKSATTILLSRVLPDPVKDVTMVCLPKFFPRSVYDPGSGQNRKDADFHCDNAAVVIDNSKNNKKSSVKDKAIFYDFEHILDGKVTGSNEMNNVFYLFNGTSLIFGGRNVVNYFYFTTHYAYRNKMMININSTNIIDISKLEHDTILIHYSSYPSINIASLNSLDENRYFADDLYKNMISDDTLKGIDFDVLQVAFISNNKTKSTLYITSDATRSDQISCAGVLARETVIINTGGSKNGFDVITGCKNVVLSPNTLVKDHDGEELHYTIYIAGGQTDENTSSHIKVKKGRIIFTGISLFQDTREIVYQKDDDLLIVTIWSGKNIHELFIEDYWNKTTNTSSYVLIDKYNSIIVPRIVSDKNHFITSFEVHHILPSDLTDNYKILEYYQNITVNSKNYNIFGTLINQQNEVFRIGTNRRDVIGNSQETIFMKGGEGSDVYLLTNSGPNDPFIVEIDNESQDRFLDILLVSYGIENIELIRVNDDLNIIFNDYTTRPNIRLLNYFEDARFRHIAITSPRPNNFGISTWIPLNFGKRLLHAQFYSHSSDNNIFFIDQSTIDYNPFVVVDLKIDNLAFYQREGDLLLTSKRNHYFHGLMLIFTDYFEDRESWCNLRLYSHHNGQISFVHLDFSTLSNHHSHLYTHLIDEYVADFTEHKEVSHNQIFNGNNFVGVEVEKEKIGIVLFKNRSLSDLECTTTNQNLVFVDSISGRELVFINWLANKKSWISMFEFDNGIKHTIYCLLTIFPNTTNLQNVIDVHCTPANIVLKLGY